MLTNDFISSFHTAIRQFDWLWAVKLPRMEKKPTKKVRRKGVSEEAETRRVGGKVTDSKCQVSELKYS